MDIACYTSNALAHLTYPNPALITTTCAAAGTPTSLFARPVTSARLPSLAVAVEAMVEATVAVVAAMVVEAVAVATAMVVAAVMVAAMVAAPRRPQPQLLMLVPLPPLLPRPRSSLCRRAPPACLGRATGPAPRVAT